MNSVHAVVVFLTIAISDIVWAFYLKAVHRVNRFNAAVMASLIIVMSVISIDAYIDSRFYAVPAVAGAFVGTFFAVGKVQT